MAALKHSQSIIITEKLYFGIFKKVQIKVLLKIIKKNKTKKKKKKKKKKNNNNIPTHIHTLIKRQPRFCLFVFLSIWWNVNGTCQYYQVI